MSPNHHNPPRWATWLLRTFGHPDTHEEVQGDLLELYAYWAQTAGERKARWRYVLSVLKLVRPLAKSNQSSEYLSPFSLSPSMIRNYLKIAWRNLVLHKAFTAINIVGLAVGLATCLLIVLFVQHELSYDRYHAKADRTFRMTTLGQVSGKEIKTAYSGVPAGPALVHDYSGVEAATRFDQEGTFIVKHNHDSFKEEHVVFADSNFFEVFSIPLLKGNPKTVLTEPNTIVLTETIAKKYFGEQDPIGQTLTLGTRGLVRVTGVCQDVPSNTHFHYDMFGSLRSIQLRDTWLSSGVYTYVVLRPGYSINDLKAKMPELVKKYIGSEIQQLFGISLAEFIRKGDGFGFVFQPVTDIHLHSDLESEIEPNSDIKYIYIFSIIAAFILLVACINFMNLSTAGSAGRAKEVGIRKVLGSIQQQLVWQFLSESILVTFIALLVSMGIVALVLPSFNQLSGKPFGFNALLSGWMLPGIVLACLLIGLLAGSYPAFFLSAFKPVIVLKGSGPSSRIRAGFRSGWLRNTLVTTQFVVSIGMIIGTMVVYQQLHFIQNKKVGFDKDQVLVLHDSYSLGTKSKAFRDELGKLSQIANVTQAGYLPAGASNNGADGFQPDNGSDQSTIYREKTYYIDENYLPTLGIGLAQGRNFSKTFPSDSAAVLINEAAANRFGWKNPIGQRLWSVGDGNPESRRLYTIVGVVKDFHFESMHQRIAPLVMFYGADNYQMALRIRTTDMPGLLKTLEQKWKAQTDTPFAYSFLNERFNRIYESEQRVGQLFGIFAGLTVIISCLGLFGLAMFTAQQRTKEIGVRKVLGASVSSVVALLSKDFLKLVVVAIIIASPLAWYAMSRWLQDFAYKIDIEWWVFVLAAFLAIGIALITVSFQSIKAALMNPVKSLRSE